MTDLLSPNLADQAWDDYESSLPTTEYKYYRPLTAAISDFERDATAVNRIYTGIPEFDAEMRGVSGGQLLTVYGHSANGKSLVANHIVRHNKAKRILYMTPDEDAPLVLAKFAAGETGISGREFEERIARHDPDAKKLLRRVAEEEYPYMCVVDGSVDAQAMKVAYEECSEAWGAEPELMVFDYLKLLQVGDDVPKKFDFIKAFGRSHNVPFMLLHQTSRSGGADGKELTLTSGEYGGESHATYMVGVRRKKYSLLAERAELRTKIAKGAVGAAEDRLAMVEHDLKVHEFTVTVNLTKNKRVGGALVDEVDFELMVGTGLLSPLYNGDLPMQYRRTLPKPVSFGGYDRTYEERELFDD